MERELLDRRGEAVSLRLDLEHPDTGFERGVASLHRWIAVGGRVLLPERLIGVEVGSWFPQPGVDVADGACEIVQPELPDLIEIHLHAEVDADLLDLFVEQDVLRCRPVDDRLQFG